MRVRQRREAQYCFGTNGLRKIDISLSIRVFWNWHQFALIVAFGWLIERRRL